MKRHPRTVVGRFVEKFVKDEASGCWLWTAGIDKYGYGKFALAHRDASRRAYLRNRGPEVVPRKRSAD